ncbi:MAG: NAD-dependent epimerase/dehydratase family protein [Lachnospiraceae bacterium]|nr:NAD-dependent epimerase/dehydratase family protein [Lachnospiraceae bacterium]
MKKKALIIGGSGGLSGRLAVLAKKEYEVWTLTRGKRPLPEGVTPILADREDTAGFQAAVFGQNIRWDVVFDCICMNELHAEQDLQVLSKVTGRLVVISTDSVYDPSKKHTPQNEQGIFIEEQGTPSACSYAGNKRKMEHVFLNYFNDSTGNLQVTLFRPGHIYGPGFLLGCFPEHSRQENLVEIIRNKEPLRLVVGGIYLTQPIFVDDLAHAMLNCVEKEKTYNEIFCIGGPEAVENKRYYEIIGELLGKSITVTEVPLTSYVEAHPGYAGHLCHRIYDLSKLKEAGVSLPSTTLYDGMKKTLKL